MSEINVFTNPAARLKNILERVIKSKNGVGLDVWAEVFGIIDLDSENEIIDVNLKLIALRKLFDETIFALQEIPDINEGLFIAPIKRLSKLVEWRTFSNSFIAYLVSEFSSYKNLLNQSDLTALNFAEDIIAKNGNFNEKLISKEELQKILDDLLNLYNGIENSALPDELIESLLELINEMRQSISEYEIRGSNALHRALTKSVGIIATYKEVFESKKDEPEIKEFVDLIRRIAEMNDNASNNKWTLLLGAGSGTFPSLV